MGLFLFIASIIGIIVINILIKKGYNKSGEAFETFDKYLEREQQANYITKKDIDESYFFKPEINKLPLDAKEVIIYEAETYEIDDDLENEFEDDLDENSYEEPIETPLEAKLFVHEQYVKELSEKPMIKFKEPMSNYDIKMKFGTFNLDIIIMYEDNFSKFIHSLLDWAQMCIELEDFSKAEKILSFSVESGSDSSKSYTLLADIYSKNSQKKELNELYQTVLGADFPAKEKALKHILKYID